MQQSLASKEPVVIEEVLQGKSLGKLVSEAEANERASLDQLLSMAYKAMNL